MEVQQSIERARNFKETLEGEYLKTLAELGLHGLAKLQRNERLFELVRGGERVEDERLHMTVAGLDFENTLIVGAGWDKKGWAVDGLYMLGFAGTEVGSVLAMSQQGIKRPRLWYKDGAGFNRMGFNSPGMEKVSQYLSGQQQPGVTGISIGKNKDTPDIDAPEAHAVVAEYLYDYGDYFVINVASPNTPGLRNLLKKEPLTDIVRAVRMTLNERGGKPLFVKTTVDLALEDLDVVLKVCVDEGADGIIHSNTSIDEGLKARYGWNGQAGGVSGDDEEYRKKATEDMKHITRETAGTRLYRIGVGGINKPEHAIERMQAGAQILQIVTGIRQRKGRIARDINLGLLEKIENDGLKNISEIVGVAA